MSEREREAAEQARQEAEAERVEQEDLRQIGEGGQERLVVGADHETGRVEAEDARVIAEDEREEAEDKRRDIRLVYAIPIAFIALLPSLLGLYLLTDYATDNRQLIKQMAADRDANRARFKRSDVLLCRSIEKLKAQNREDAEETFDNLDRTLRILRLSRTDEIEAVALENLQNDLRRNEAREDGCGKLPSVRTSNPKEESNG